MSAAGSSRLATLRSPKLDGGKAQQWYRYYAGFSPKFVRDAFELVDAGPNGRVLDPWMGSGTTLSVVASRGCAVSGLDLNPAMAVIAKGRLIAVDTELSVEPLAREILKHLRPDSIAESELLTNWFTRDTASLIRGLIRRIDRVLIVDGGDAIAKVERMSSLAAFYYVAAFEVTTSALKAYGSRNPTWVKRGTRNGGTAVLSRAELGERFMEAVRRLAAYVQYNAQISVQVRDESRVAVGDSREQPFADDSCSAAITSPPYLTRLDYVIGHLPELAVLGLTEGDVQGLRRKMIGTPTIQTGASESGAPIGRVAEGILDRVAEHESYAAKTYYAPNFRQYFDGMAASLAEIGRVCRPSSNVVMVVQDSRFKDVHVDLAAAMRAMAEASGWTHVAQKDFVSLRSIAQLNSRAHETARTTKPVESVLLLQTPAKTSTRDE